MDGARDGHTKGSQKEKDKYHMMLLTCGIEDMTEMNLFMKHRLTDGDTESLHCTPGTNTTLYQLYFEKERRNRKELVHGSPHRCHSDYESKCWDGNCIFLGPELTTIN